MAKPTTNRVIFENELELITFTLDGHLLHTHKPLLSNATVSMLGRISKAPRRPLIVALVKSDGETRSSCRSGVKGKAQAVSTRRSAPPMCQVTAYPLKTHGVLTALRPILPLLWH